MGVSGSLKWAGLWPQVKVQQEERNSRVNRTKLNHAWRVILRQARSEQLRDDIVVLRRTFERQLDGRDDVIQVVSVPAKCASRHVTSQLRSFMSPAEFEHVTSCLFLPSRLDFSSRLFLV